LCRPAWARRREYRRNHPHPESAESRKKSNRKYRISSYGLTQEHFDRLLDTQQHTCGMCHEPFEEGQLIHVDHDHACCRGKNRSCGECVRGLLCHTCNIALGHIERRYGMARAYLGQPSRSAPRRRLAFKQKRPPRRKLWQDSGLEFTTTIGTILDQHNIRREFRQITVAAAELDEIYRRAELMPAGSQAAANATSA
jgi:Recombination endonuclease VII